MTRTRDQCQAALQYAIEQRMLPPYSPSGRYVRANVKSKVQFDSDDQELTHYARRDGQLFSDERAWRRAHALVSTFVAPQSGHGQRPWWTLDDFVGFDDVTPVELLELLDSAMKAAAFELRIRDDSAFFSSYVLQDHCRVRDLPEPYGKWCQRERRPKWGKDVDLVLEAEFTTFSRELGTRGRGVGATVRLSAPATGVPTILCDRLAQLLELPPESARSARTVLQKKTSIAFRAALSRMDH